ncbi:hypothetical protein BU25DRAFT_107224 [Macroventuria anomochaeta]|uniref:Uncharacterized protein n=1 Tax=Macroventuria anomochaeta TaxID=301207 RepID=A0ACB6RVE7_9PLEO|nr:uncharacterized protein BU25DRAFT_107224 [Macroventuria anomochaeta]KAF2626016.1 hypothetical protein BU25DRAFT_107224 [Macroventuria anomochaeta]
MLDTLTHSSLRQPFSTKRLVLGPAPIRTRSTSSSAQHHSTWSRNLSNFRATPIALRWSAQRSRWVLSLSRPPLSLDFSLINPGLSGPNNRLTSSSSHPVAIPLPVPSTSPDPDPEPEPFDLLDLSLGVECGVLPSMARPVTLVALHQPRAESSLCPTQWGWNKGLEHVRLHAGVAMELLHQARTIQQWMVGRIVVSEACNELRSKTRYQNASTPKDS